MKTPQYIAKRIHDQNSAACHLYCTVNGAAYMREYADTLSIMPESQRVVADIYDNANHSILVAKMIAGLNTNLPTEVAQELVAQSKAFRPSSLDYTLISENSMVQKRTKDLPQYIRAIRQTDTVEEQMGNLNILLMADRYGLSMRVVELSNEGVPVGNKSHEDYLIETTEEVLEFLTTFNPEFSKEMDFPWPLEEVVHGARLHELAHPMLLPK